jgi:hypothetical protein
VQKTANRRIIAVACALSSSIAASNAVVSSMTPGASARPLSALKL